MKKNRLNPSTLLSFAHIRRKITIYKTCLLCLKALNLNTESVSAGLGLSLFSTPKQDVRQMLAIVQSSVHRVRFNFSFLSLPFNPVTSAPRAGEVSQRLSHGLRANPTPRALPEGRPSVHSVWSVLRGKASAA